MRDTPQTPSDLARRIGARRDASNRARVQDRPAAEGASENGGIFKRETYTLPREEARAKVGEWFDNFPKAAYMTEVEYWRELADGRIEFTMRRLPSAD